MISLINQNLAKQSCSGIHQCLQLGSAITNEKAVQIFLHPLTQKLIAMQRKQNLSVLMLLKPFFVTKGLVPVPAMSWEKSRALKP